MKRTQNIKGFTIIEVVLVLAIAGLIFLMVFIALPALQAGQRDTARKNDLNIVSTAVTSYYSGNRGALLPTTDNARAGTLLQSYVTGIDTKVTTKTDIKVQGVGAQTVAPSTTAIVVVQKARCNTVEAGSVKKYTTKASTVSSQFAVIRLLEGGGGAATCING